MSRQGLRGKETPWVLILNVLGAEGGSRVGVSKPTRLHAQSMLLGSGGTVALCLPVDGEDCAHFSLDDGASVLALLYPTLSFHEIGWSFVTAAHLTF